jgi:ankyrin repeat protein
VAAGCLGLFVLAAFALAIVAQRRADLASAATPTTRVTIAPHSAAAQEAPAGKQPDVNLRDDDGRTALWRATAERDHAAAGHLLDSGADVDVPDVNGITPLMLAASRGDLEFAKMFLARNADAEFRDAQGHSAVHHAISAGRSEAFEFLLDARPNRELGDEEAAELLSLTDDSGQPEMVAAVLNRMPGNRAWTAESRRALQTSLSRGQTALTRLLLEKHATPPTVEGKTTPLLVQAVLADDADTLHELLAAGANANLILPTPPEKDFLAALPGNLRDYAKGDTGVTPLMIAAGLGKPETVRALLEAGAERNRLTSRYKMMALYFAAHSRNWRSVQLLLGGGPLPDKLRIEVSLRAQRAAVIRDGTQIFETQCSTGRDGFSTPTGQYVITDKDLSHRSTIYKVEMPYFMRLNCLDFGMHESGSVPSYPASHGCIRLPAAAARKLFSEIPVGTVVMIN